MTLHWTLLGRFEVGDCYEYVGLFWVRKAAVWIQFNLQTRFQPLLEVLGISKYQIWNASGRRIISVRFS